MSVSMYQASAPVFLRGLGVLSAELKKAQAHVVEHGGAADALLGARLAPDMLALASQVQRSSDTAKASVERLSGVAAPKFPDEESSFEQLQERIANTMAYIGSVGPEHYTGSAQREVEMKFGAARKVFSGDQYLLQFGLPNFFFHVATAHGILRNQGVKVGKIDYLGAFE
ncbi:MAG TPA: DUF1993 domain-containing protein [Janthinobacterium sp.]|nr:DUF1993 domain-containing protein [Janthinobacterium sp.]